MLPATLRIEISLSTIRRGKVPPLLTAPDPQRLSPAALRALRGIVSVVFADAQPLPLPLLLDPQARRFFRQVHAQWPHAAFFCDPGSAFLAMLLLAQLTSLRALPAPRPDSCQVVYDQAEWQQLRDQESRRLLNLAKQAQLSPKATVSACNDLRRYACGCPPNLRPPHPDPRR